MSQPTTYQPPRRRRRNDRWGPVWSFLSFMLAVTAVILGFTFMAERDSCLRQSEPRSSANARRAVVNDLVQLLQAEKLGTEEQRIRIAVKTEKIQSLPELDCGLPWPDTE